jgi:hypothetical protein
MKKLTLIIILTALAGVLDLVIDQDTTETVQESIAVGAILGLAGSAINYFSGRKAAKEAERLAKQQRKEGRKLLAEAEAGFKPYEIPESIKEATAEAKASAQGDSQYKKAMISASDRMLSNARDGAETSATSASQAQAFIQSANNKAFENLEKTIAEEEFIRQEKRRDLNRRRDIESQFEDQEYQINVLDPYNNKRQEGNALIAASYGNQQDANTAKAQGGIGAAQLLGTLSQLDLGEISFGGKTK